MLPWLSRLKPSSRSRSARAARLDPALDEQADVLRAGAAERRLGDHLAVDDRPVVVRAVAVVVDAGGRR